MILAGGSGRTAAAGIHECLTTGVWQPDVRTFPAF